METVIIKADGRIAWKGTISRQLKRNDEIEVGNTTYRVVAAKFASGVQTILVSSRPVTK